MNSHKHTQAKFLLKESSGWNSINLDDSIRAVIQSTNLHQIVKSELQLQNCFGRLTVSWAAPLIPRS